MENEDIIKNDSDIIKIRIPKISTEKLRENPWVVSTFVLGILVLVLVVNGTGDITGEITLDDDLTEGTFYETGDDICLDDEGKPYVVLFSTTWCPHCVWIKDTFDALADEEFAGRINLQHWDIDVGDNTLTEETETEVPEDIMNLYRKYNPRGSIPTFAFGCKYSRIGNGYESQNDLNAELEEFKFMIGELLN